MKKGLQILSCYSQPGKNATVEYLECTRHAILAYSCVCLLILWVYLLIKLSKNKKIKKNIDNTKIYLIVTLIIFDILNFMHFGIYLDDANVISTWLKANM